jgi:RND family efflux transporter MFP subunit
VISAPRTLPCALAVLALVACSRSDAEAPRAAPGTAVAQGSGAGPGGQPSPRPAGPGAPGAASAVRAIPITAGRAEARAVQRSVETSGSLLAWDEVQAKSEQQGTIARLRVDLGDRVAAGAILADYDRREFELAVQQAEADLNAARENLGRAHATAAATAAQVKRVRDTRESLEADVARAQSQVDWMQSELSRARQLFERELVAAREVDSARNQYNVSAAQLTAARVALAQHPEQLATAEAQHQADLAAVKTAEAQVRQREAALGITRKRFEDTTVRAPIAGLVARRHVNAGEFVKDNTPLFTIVATTTLKYAGTIPERYAPELRGGQPVRLTVEAYPGQEFTGTVTRLAPAVDVQTRTMALEARVPNESGTLRPGFFAKGSILTQARASAVFVPAEAVTYVAGLSKVFVVAGTTVQERLVRPGGRQGTWVEIADGIKPGDTVATSNLPALFNGAPVTLPAPTK